MREKQISRQVKIVVPKNFASVIIALAVLLYSPSAAQQQKSVSDKAYRDGIIEKIRGLLEEKYVFPDRAGKYAEEFLRQNRSGSYDAPKNAAEFADKVTQDLQAITGDKHIRLRLIEPSDIGEKTESALHHPVRLFLLRNKENAGFFRLEWIDGKIGYLDIRRFYSPPESKDLFVAAMRFLSHANAIIIDLRENQGGSTDILPFLFRYFLDYPAQLTSNYFREGDFLQESWICKEIEGKALTTVPLFLLTSQRTFSAAEWLAYDMKVRKRATIVGEPTKGGAHSVDLFKIDDQFEIYIPTSRAINPVTGGNWEGTGVIPDVPVPSEAALDKAIELAKTAAEKHWQEKEKSLRAAVEEMEGQLSLAEKLFREDKKEAAETALDSVFQIGDRHGLINEFFVNVLAYSYSSDQDEKIVYAILKKNIEFFPKSSTAYDSLAYAYFSHGRKEEAIGYLKKVLELDPDDRNAKKMIERLESNR
jgi:C-terminal processing protease CtpA/Prc